MQMHPTRTSNALLSPRNARRTGPLTLVIDYPPSARLRFSDRCGQVAQGVRRSRIHNVVETEALACGNHPHGAGVH